MLESHVIPVLNDNYVFILRDQSSEKTAVVDPAVAGPVLEFLEQRSWKLDFILNTHHHYDHVGGNLEIKEKTRCKVVGHKNDSSRIPGIDIEILEGDKFELGDSQADILSLDGHTIGHIAYYFADSAKLFCGDTLFSVGCGRLFEGTPKQMFESLQKLKTLPDETKVFCAHEYTLSNIEFALSLDSGNKELLSYQNKVQSLRSKGQFSIPCHLDLEKRINPFLTANSAEVFAERRNLKDRF